MFVPDRVTVVASGPVAVTFRNDSTLPHNLVFTPPLTFATRTIVEPGDGELLVLEPIDAGPHPFICTIHDGMAGVLVVERAAP